MSFILSFSTKLPQDLSHRYAKKIIYLMVSIRFQISLILNYIFQKAPHFNCPGVLIDNSCSLVYINLDRYVKWSIDSRCTHHQIANSIVGSLRYSRPIESANWFADADLIPNPRMACIIDFQIIPLSSGNQELPLTMKFDIRKAQVGAKTWQKEKCYWV